MIQYRHRSIIDQCRVNECWTMSFNNGMTLFRVDFKSMSSWVSSHPIATRLLPLCCCSFLTSVRFFSTQFLVCYPGYCSELNSFTVKYVSVCHVVHSHVQHLSSSLRHMCIFIFQFKLDTLPLINNVRFLFVF